jgi:4-hydroxy-3-methylbut-2-en-1-yl diphosphate synthase IspG/GcpE
MLKQTSMKKISFIFILAIASAASVKAQSVQTTKAETVKAAVNNVEEMAKAETDKLDKIVKLNDDQRKAVLEISTKLAMKQQELDKAAPDAKDRYMKEIEMARTNMYMSQLTEAQIVLYKETLQK